MSTMSKKEFSSATVNVIMKKQQDQQSNENRSESPALKETGATTSRQVQREAADKTSHPGRPGPDELVPSRYALNVGEIDVMVVSDGIIGVASDGVIGLPTKMLAHNADPAARAAWMEDRFLPPDTFGWALNAVVARSGGRTILIDAGFGEEYPGAPRAGRWD